MEVVATKYDKENYQQNENAHATYSQQKISG